LRRRHDAGLPGLTPLSCDNLADNGLQLERLMTEYLDRHIPDLLGWFRAECACPSTMVDRIVPATTETDRAELAARVGLRDAAAVMTEPFSQWVIEDRFAGPRPRWEAVGAELVADVRPYETAKLRMLNGAHSLLAYCGLNRGHAFVHQAIADPHLRASSATHAAVGRPNTDACTRAGLKRLRRIPHKTLRQPRSESQPHPNRHGR
jgi:fructuronate reductase